MPSRTPDRTLPRTLPRTLRSPGVALLALALVAGGLLLSSGRFSAQATSNPRTPGNFTGKGFDQCNAPTQRAMNVWRRSSPYQAVGIYISGNSRACREQPNLTPTWVSKQLANGWHLLPITLGPQASCASRFPRYGATIDPTIIPERAYTWAKARAQARAEADKAVAAAQALGIVKGSTLFYDLEGFDLNHTVSCRGSAKWFLSSWSNQLHRRGYLSGVYSSAGSGIVLLDRARQDPPANYVLPDMIWIARWDGNADTSSPQYLSDTGWADHQRVKQYRGGHDETWPRRGTGRVTINVDSNYLDVRNRRVPAAVAERPSGPTPTPTPSPTAAPGSLADAKCTGDSISRPSYRRTDATHNRRLIVPLQCLLKQQYLYTGPVTGRWTAKTVDALNRFQDRQGWRRHPYATRSNWMALTAAGATDRTLQRGARGADVIRLQRALNAAGDARLRVTGSFGTATQAEVRRYQQAVLGRATGVVATLTWRALHAGRW